MARPIGPGTPQRRLREHRRGLGASGVPNVNATVAAVGAIPPARLRRMAAAMARAARLDYRDGLVDAALRHVVKGRLVVAAKLLQRVQDAGGVPEPEGPASSLRVERV